MIEGNPDSIGEGLSPVENELNRQLLALQIDAVAERELEDHTREFNVDISNALSMAVCNIAAHIDRPDIANELLDARDIAAAAYTLKAKSTTLAWDESLRNNSGLSEEDATEMEETLGEVDS